MRLALSRMSLSPVPSRRCLRRVGSLMPSKLQTSRTTASDRVKAAWALFDSKPKPTKNPRGGAQTGSGYVASRSGAVEAGKARYRLDGQASTRLLAQCQANHRNLGSTQPAKPRDWNVRGQ